TPTTPILMLTNPVPTNGYFGWSAAISGTRIAVGQEANDTGASGAGIAYIYDLNGVSPATPALTLTNPAPGPADSFGYSLAMSGPRLVVGVKGDSVGEVNAGSAYVYELA